jgi:hypothetical protein
MKQGTFPYRREYSTLIGEIHRPVATIDIQGKNKKWRGFTLYADSLICGAIVSRLIATSMLRKVPSECSESQILMALLSFKI